MRGYKVEIYRDRRGEWRWTLFAPNGRKLANSGEGYRRRDRVRKAVKNVQRVSWNCEIVERGRR